MKNLFTILCVALIMPLFYACGSDDPMDDPNDPDNPTVVVPENESLLGTWQFERGNVEYYYNFKTNGKCDMHIIKDNDQIFWTEFDYKQYPTEKIVELKKDTKIENIHYTFKGKDVVFKHLTFEVNSKKVNKNFIYTYSEKQPSVIIDGKIYKGINVEFNKFEKGKDRILTLNVENSEPFQITFKKFTKTAFYETYQYKRGLNLLKDSYLAIGKINVGTEEISPNINSRVVIVYADDKLVILDVYIENARQISNHKTFMGTIVGKYN